MLLASWGGGWAEWEARAVEYREQYRRAGYRMLTWLFGCFAARAMLAQEAYARAEAVLRENVAIGAPVACSWGSARARP